jgi:uncharacterized protein (DUF433 family)
VPEDSQGVLRVGPPGVSPDSVVIAFQQGHSAETIQQLYSALSLEEVYGAIAFYQSNPTEGGLSSRSSRLRGESRFSPTARAPR